MRKGAARFLSTEPQHLKKEKKIQNRRQRLPLQQCQYKAALGGLRAEAALKLGKNPHVEMPITAVITVVLTSTRLS